MEKTPQDPQLKAMMAKRVGGLRRFAFAITFFNVLGHMVLGFEQSIAQPLIAVATAYTFALLLESIEAALIRKRPRYWGSVSGFIDFLLSAHISAMAISMLLYANDRLLPVMFATMVAVGSKTLFRVRVDGRLRHFLNPSNFGITVTLLLFPWIGIAPPYHFTENFGAVGDWVLPCIIIVSGSFLNTRYTSRMPLLAAWIVGFGLQAVLRSVLFGTPVTAALAPMTGVAFVLFTFYMVTDPPTTPSRRNEQILFGASVAALYGVLVAFHVVFGIFFALSIVCAVRGLWMHATGLVESIQFVTVGRKGRPVPVAQQVSVGAAMVGK